MQISIGFLVFLLMAALLVFNGVRSILEGAKVTKNREVSGIGAYGVGVVFLLAAAAVVGTGYYMFIF